jgi:hypothetical protein
MAMKRSPQKWTESELNYVRKNHAKKRISEIAAYLDRDPNNVSFKARSLGLSKKTNKKYSPEEDQILLKYEYEGKDILKRLPGRSIESVNGRLDTMRKQKDHELSLSQIKTESISETIASEVERYLTSPVALMHLNIAKEKQPYDWWKRRENWIVRAWVDYFNAVAERRAA